MGESPKPSEPSSEQQRLKKTDTQWSRSSAEVLVGEVLRPHGVQGEVLIGVLSENPRRFSPGVTLLAGSAPDSAIKVKVASARPHSKGLIVRFDSADSREEAEELRGLLLFVRPEDLPEAEEGSWWEKDIVGMRVVDEKNNELGQVARVITLPKQDLWEVATPGGTVQVPAVAEIIRKVDTAAGVIVIAPPPGLFE